MKKTIKNSIYGMQTGIVLGLFISLVFNYLYGSTHYYPSSPQFSEHFTNSLNAVLVSIILWATIGLLFSLGAIIFEVENWSLLKRTIINFFIYYLGFTPLAILAGWFPLNIYYLISFTITFILIYIIMWLVNVAISRHQINEINKRIKEG